MNIDIEKINTFEKRSKVNKNQWRKIYEFIEEDYLEESDISPYGFIKKCKDNANEAQFLPLDVKNNIKKMAMEQGLYAQVVMLRRKDLKLIGANKNKNEAKLKFQGQSAISQSWFDIEFHWIEVNSSTHEPNFYKKLLQSHDGT